MLGFYKNLLLASITILENEKDGFLCLVDAFKSFPALFLSKSVMLRISI